MKIHRAERQYHGALRNLARQVGLFIAAWDFDRGSLPKLNEMLAAYATAIEPWAIRTAAKMLKEVDQRDAAVWRQAGQAIGREMSIEVLSAPTGRAYMALLEAQVGLIKSIPLEAAQRVQRLATEGLHGGKRASEIVKELARSGEVAEGRARTIARTETSRAASTFTEARAQHLGSPGYIWMTSEDGDVRESHREMLGKFVPWGQPPTLDGMTGHAGCLPNCRCYPKPVLPG